MTNYALSEDADLDLADIRDYIHQDSIDAADRWIEKLFEAFEFIAANPGIGHKREDLTTYPVLFWSAGAYVVIYRAAVLPLQIVAITQGAQDIPAFLKKTQ